MSAAEKEALEMYHPMQADVAIHRPPEKVLEEARQAARALTDVISKKLKPVKFNGEIYLEFEDWQTVGRFYGITAKVRDTKFVQYDKVSGFEASADALLVSTGQVISSADAMCLNDEPNWSKKPMFQLRSMAQTRACAKSLRNVLAWVVVLAGYKPTPAEEMDGVFHPQKDKAQTEPPHDDVGDLFDAAAPKPKTSKTSEPVCPKCKSAMNYNVEGITKTGKNAGKHHNAYWKCTQRGCDGFTWAEKSKSTEPTYQEGSDPDPLLNREPGQEG